MPHATRTLLAACVAALLTAPLVQAAPTAEQQGKAQTAEETLLEAGKLVIGKQYGEAIPLLEKAQTMLAELAASGADGKRLVAPLEVRLEAARRILSANGVKLAEPPKPATPGTPAAGGISFTKQIAPILVARCNNCHVAQTRGGFNLGTFANLMKGSTSGIVLMPGKSDGSRLIEVLDSGDMPRGGGKLPDDQITLIAKWIDAGAKFDGSDPNAAIGAGLPTPSAAPALAVVKASGNESIRFSRDIAPVLADTCAGCHGGQQPPERLSLETFARLLSGSQNGPILTPGKPAESLLIKKLRGTAGDRMPKDRPPLSEETIAKFEKWIAEGAKFDGSSATMNVDMVAKIYKASVMSHEELAAERVTLGLKNWQLSAPDEQPEKLESENFVLYGNVGEDELARVRDVAEAQQSRVVKMLKGPTTGPFLKGRVTLFVFKRRYDYSEHGRMVERREIPPDWYGHWRFNVVDAYACVVPPDDKEYSLTALVAEQLAGTYLDSLSKDGKLPEWFSQGSAWAVASNIDGKDPRIQLWDDRIPAALAGSSKPDDFLTGALPPGDTAVLNYSFCKFLMSNSKAYSTLLAGLREKKEFNQAFGEAYRADPKLVAAAWALKVASSKRR